MKKIFYTFLVLLLVLIQFVPFITIKAEELSECSSYLVAYSYSFDNNDVPVSCHTDYNEALEKMNSIESDTIKVAIIKKNNRIINARTALVRTNAYQLNSDGTMDSSKSNVVLTVQTDVGLSVSYTYINGRYGIDGAFIGYNPSTNEVNFKLSGLVVWAQLGNVSIVPISKFFATKGKITASGGLNMRSDASIDGTILTTVPYNTICDYAPYKTITDETRSWAYARCSVNGTSYTGYIASEYMNLYQANDFNTYYAVAKDGNGISEIYHNTRYQESNGTIRIEQVKLGVAPSFMETNKKYYSFDGNYFYVDPIMLIEDYKNKTYEHALNYEKPYYAYFMYLPSHSLSGYTSDTFNAIINARYNTGPEEGVTYYVPYCVQVIKPSSNMSVMYNSGDAFIEAQNTYGVNALMMFSKAISESAWGTSAIAFFKNNLFGMGASDYAPCQNARSYADARESILDYAKETGSTTGSYNDPSDWRYAGGHYGNKAGGMNVEYASDPYWGESSASISYSNDKIYGQLDNDSNTLGIKDSSKIVSVYKQPNSNSSVIYKTQRTKNGKTFVIPQVSFIVLDKVIGTDGLEYYKVNTDPGLDENGNKVNTYNFDLSVGYVLATELYVSNTQPTIEVEDKEVIQGHTIDLLENITANDIEDGDISNDITVDDSNVDIYIPGDYTIYYTVKDSSRYSKTVSATLTVIESGFPIIRGTDTTISALKTFDPLKDIEIIADEDLSDKITYTIKQDDNEIALNDMIKNVGTYKIYYNVKNSANKNAETYIRTVTVILNQFPTILAENITVKQNSSIDYKANVSATDNEDGNVTSRITYDNSNVNLREPGTYTLIYSVTDLDNQKTEYNISVIVESENYVSKTGYLHLEKLEYDEELGKLKVEGFLNIDKMTITKNTNIIYDIVFENQLSKKTTTYALNRLLADVPFNAINNESWFIGYLDLSVLEDGDYTIYLRGRVGTSEVKMKASNPFFNNSLIGKFKCNDKGYYLRNNYANRELPIELFVRSDGLFTYDQNNKVYNLYNQIYSVSLTNSTLNIKGTSHTYGIDYSNNINLTRYMVFENISTFERYSNNIGFISNGPYKVSFAVSDGYSKAKAWYDATIDISTLSKGTYAIYTHTITNNANDFGEIYDYLWNPDIGVSGTYTKNGKTYVARLSRNNDVRFRIELIIEEISN